MIDRKKEKILIETSCSFPWWLDGMCSEIALTLRRSGRNDGRRSHKLTHLVPILTGLTTGLGQLKADINLSNILHTCFLFEPQIKIENTNKLNPPPIESEEIFYTIFVENGGYFPKRGKLYSSKKKVFVLELIKIQKII